MIVEELRLGNYVYDDMNNIIKIDHQDIGEELYIFYKPIELTEEILLKSGFVARGTFWFDLHLDEKTKLTIGWHPDGRIDFEISINKIYFDISHIKHLHQLQNLYWCLCGKELNIEL